MTTLSMTVLLGLLTAPSPVQDLLQQQRRGEARSHYRAGEEYMLSEAFEEAANEFQKATQKDPVFAPAFYSLGQARMALKDYPAALAAYTSCRELILREVSLDRRAKGEIERQRRDDRLTAMKDQVGRENLGGVQIPAELSLGLGSAYFRLNHMDKAEQNYRAAISINGKLGEAHNNLAVIYMLSDRLDEAAREIETAEEAGFTVSAQFKRELAERQSAKTKP